MHHDRTGQLVSAQEVTIGIALLEVGSLNEIKVATQLLKYARAMKKIM